MTLLSYNFMKNFEYFYRFRCVIFWADKVLEIITKSQGGVKVFLALGRK